ncbi:ribonuclease H-like domain-containing protein [Robbsia andropogonis]|uniref:ribonuclease H-like domain-containing protein n=1 Tax=Robbsia andropogonis TaxID=28092 RepID=UPI002A69E32B|nr:ribonuclease H-like domain-containing protein [Robbsia andropogonis]
MKVATQVRRQQTKRPRILFLDIETSPVLGYVWSLWKQNVGLNQIHREWCILSYSAKWLGDDKVLYEDTFRQRNREDDKRLVRKLWRLMDAADIIVAQNGVKFDVKKIQARMILQGHPPPSPFKVVDTMLEARKHFGFTSNKLEWLTDKLCTKYKKLKHGKFPGFELWKQYLAGNQEAADEMAKYNKYDVLSLEELYLVMRPWMQGHPNIGNYSDAAGEGPKCPHCGSENVRRRGLRYTQVGQYPRYHCGECNAWSRGRLTTNSKAHKANLLIS